LCFVIVVFLKGVGEVRAGEGGGGKFRVGFILQQIEWRAEKWRRWVDREEGKKREGGGIPQLVELKSSLPARRPRRSTLPDDRWKFSTQPNSQLCHLCIRRIFTTIN